MVTTEVSTTTPILVPSPSLSPVNNSSNTGAIDGIVGGITTLAFLALLCLCRRRERDEFDCNFDPDRVVSHPSGGGTLYPVDLGDENKITPATTICGFTGWEVSSITPRKIANKYCLAICWHYLFEFGTTTQRN
ncbi:hypothetical protein P692DRAFT_20218289 [Suillus brevipes Sb2]|nr:hypothetical protein P692DRAFT_20218289 [Suillus brevipes Sb2]